MMDFELSSARSTCKLNLGAVAEGGEAAYSYRYCTCGKTISNLIIVCNVEDTVILILIIWNAE